MNRSEHNPLSYSAFFSAPSAPLRCIGLSAVLTVGACTERRIHITSEPDGALVTLNDVQVGETPCEIDFTYFGVYDVRLRKEGFEPLNTRAEAKAPFHEWPVIDLVALAIPVKKRTRIDWHFILEPANNDPAALIRRASEMRGTLEPRP